MQGYDDEAQKVEQQMIQKYEEDLHLFEEEIEKMIPLKNKDSATLLNLKKIEEKLAKQEKFYLTNKINFNLFLFNI